MMQIAPGIDATEWQRLKLDDPNGQDLGCCCGHIGCPD